MRDLMILIAMKLLTVLIIVLMIPIQTKKIPIPLQEAMVSEMRVTVREILIVIQIVMDQMLQHLKRILAEVYS